MKNKKKEPFKIDYQMQALFRFPLESEWGSANGMLNINSIS